VDELKSNKKFNTDELTSNKKYNTNQTINTFIKNTKIIKNRINTENIIDQNNISNISLVDHLKKFEILGTGIIKLNKKTKVFKKTKGKGINACIKYPILLKEGVKSFKFKIVSENEDQDSLLTFIFEKPYKSNYICKTRMLKNGVGITSSGQSIGQFNNLRCDFSLKSGDVVESVVDFEKNIVSFLVNDSHV